jgi:uncharacterized membrane protein
VAFTIYRAAVGLAIILLLSTIVLAPCEACSRSVANLASIPLEYVGLAFYSLLAGLSFTSHRFRLLDAIYLGVGFHIQLITATFRDGKLCSICLAVALCCIVAGACAARHSRGIVLALFAFLIGALSARYLTSSLFADDLVKHTDVITALGNVAPSDHYALTIYVLSKDDCEVCFGFWAVDAEKLRHAFGPRLQLHKIDTSDQHIPLPTFVVYSPFQRPKVIFGLPRIEDLGAYLRSLQYWRPNHALQRTAPLSLSLAGAKGVGATEDRHSDTNQAAQFPAQPSIQFLEHSMRHGSSIVVRPSSQ